MGRYSCDSSSELVLYEDALEAGLRLPIPGPICQILGTCRWLLGGWPPMEVILAFFSLWQLVHGTDVPPSFEEFLATYVLLDNPSPYQGWCCFAPRLAKFITRLPLNCHNWKSRSFFVGKEWAAKGDRDLVPSRWDIVPRTKLGNNFTFTFTSSRHGFVLTA